jgi:hypothetical protein
VAVKARELDDWARQQREFERLRRVQMERLQQVGSSSSSSPPSSSSSSSPPPPMIG